MRAATGPYHGIFRNEEAEREEILTVVAYSARRYIDRNNPVSYSIDVERWEEPEVVLNIQYLVSNHRL